MAEVKPTLNMAPGVSGWVSEWVSERVSESE